MLVTCVSLCRQDGQHADVDSTDRILNVQFSWGHETKEVSSIFIGTSPEFELALYTLCFVAGAEVRFLSALLFFLGCHEEVCAMSSPFIEHHSSLSMGYGAWKVQVVESRDAICAGEYSDDSRIRDQDEVIDNFGNPLWFCSCMTILKALVHVVEKGFDTWQVTKLLRRTYHIHSKYGDKVGSSFPEVSHSLDLLLRACSLVCIASYLPDVRWLE